MATLFMWGQIVVLGLGCSCRDWGSHAEIEVLMPRLRCSCRDWGAHAEIELLRPRLRSKMAPQSQHEHSNLGMSTSILAWAPQSQHSSYPPKSNSLFWGEWNKISNIIFYLQVGDIYKKYILQKMAGKPSTWPQQWPKQFAPLYVRPEPPPR